MSQFAIADLQWLNKIARVVYTYRVIKRMIRKKWGESKQPFNCADYFVRESKANKSQYLFNILFLAERGGERFTNQ